MTENKRLKVNEEYLSVMRKINLVGYDEWITPMELVDKYNSLLDENEQLKNKIKSLTIELSTHKHPLWSTREAERKVSELTELLMNETKKNAVLLEEINSLRIENMRLKKLQRY